MTIVLVTGATGFIGRHLVMKLVEQGITVNALYRSTSSITDLQYPGISWFKGDVTDRKSIDTAMKSCRFVFHLAAYAQAWSKDKNTYRKSIMEGTVNVMESALKYGVEKIVITSTAGVFGPSTDNIPVNEDTERKVDYFSDYEKYKDLVDQYIVETYTDRINFCIVCPTRVFGPGLLSQSNSVTKLIRLYREGKFHFLPGNGQSVGNYVYVDDVIKGMFLALQNGKRGERYILGGDNVSYCRLFEMLGELSGKKYKLYKLPVRLILLAAQLMLLRARIFGIPPLITPGWVRKFMYTWTMSTEKAEKELGYQSLNLKSGLRKTLVWLLAQNENK